MKSRKFISLLAALLFSNILFASERIISLAPAVTEILYYIGAQNDLVGVTNVCDYPEEAKRVEKVGDFVNPVIEKIINLKPTIIIGMDLNDKKMGRFGELGIKYVNIKVKNVEDIPKAIAEIGKVSGYEKNANLKAKKFVKDIKRIEEKNKRKNRPKVFIAIWGSPLMTAGKTSIISDIIERAGGENIAGDITEEYPIYSIEQVLTKKPKYILSDKNIDISKFKGNAEVITDIDPNIIMRPGPRVIRAIEILNEKFDKIEKK